MTSTSKPTELRLGAPKPYDGSPETANQWLNTVRFYLAVNETVYDTDAKRIAYALSHMTKGSALTWANTFRQTTIKAATISFGSFTDFCTDFQKTFEQKDTVANAVSWLATKRMTPNPKRKGEYLPSLATYTAEFKSNVTLSGITDANVLIGFYSVGIPEPLMR